MSSSPRSKKGLLILIVIAAVIAGFLAVGHIRKAQAVSNADDFAQQHPVSTSFTVAEDSSNERVFAEEIVRLARFEEAAKTQIDEIYKPYHSGNLERVKELGQINGYQNKVNLEKEVLAARWKELRIQLDRETLTSLSAIYQNAGGKAPKYPQQSDVIAYYQRDGFSHLCRLMSKAEEGNPEEVFRDWRPGWSYTVRDGDDWVLPDLLYLLWPEEILRGYEGRIQEAIESVNTNELEDSIHRINHAVTDGEELQKRYGCTFSNLEEGQERLASLQTEYRERKAQAEEERKRRIQEQFDQIYSSHKSNYNAGADPVDPDDHDIDGYYEDYKDEYDDVDDAWDGFLDDEDAWDDY